jgi:hypothetical protein
MEKISQKEFFDYAWKLLEITEKIFRARKSVGN